MTSQHTPGPWTFTDDPEYNCFYVDAQNGAIGVADVVRLPVKDQGLANARLIAAAPDLLAALIDAESAMFHVLADDGFATPFDQKAMKDAMQAARAVLAKARGQ